MSEARASRLPVVFGALGTTLEWYDFTLFVYLAPVIAGLFFSGGSPTEALLATLGVFAVGYVMRPLGAIFFGGLGDRRGRKVSLTLSVAMMSVPMLAIGLLPTEATIGIAAPILLVVCRLLQGFSIGGEFGGSLVLLAESAAPGRRGFVTNLAQMTAGAGFLLSSVTAAVLHTALATEQMNDFGWRIPFILGAGIGLLALVIRARMEETESFREAQAAGELEASPVRAMLRRDRRALLRVVALMGYLGAAFYLAATFVPTYLSSVIGVRPGTALFAATIAALLYTVLTPLAGAWSDRVGRKPLMLWATVGFAALALPVFALFADGQTGPIIVAQTLLIGLVIVFTGASTPAIAEMFGTGTRASGVTVGYGFGLAIFGGTAPLVALALVHATGSDLAPALYLIAGSLLVLPLVARLPETLPAGDGRN